MIGTSGDDDRERMTREESRDVMASGLAKDLPDAKRRKLVGEISNTQSSKTVILSVGDSLKNIIFIMPQMF